MFYNTPEEKRIKEAALELFTGEQEIPRRAFIKGPPGSGKCEFLMVVALEFVRQHKRVLILAPPDLKERMVYQLKHSRKHYKFPECYLTDEFVAYEYDQMGDMNKRLIIGTIPDSGAVCKTNIDAIILVHLNEISCKTLQEACDFQGLVLASFDNGLPRQDSSAISLLENGEIPDCKILKLPHSNRSFKLLTWSRVFCYAGEDCFGSHNRRTKLTFVDSEMEHEQIIRKVKELRERGVSEEDIGVTAVTQGAVNALRFFLDCNSFEEIRVANMDYWSKRSVDHFLMAMCSYEEIIIKKEEINQFITTARCTLTVFGSVKAMKNRLKIMDEQDHPYWIGFHELFDVNLMESVDEDQKAPLPVLRKLLCQDETPIANPENTDEKQKVETAELKQEVSGNDQAFPLLEKIRLSLIAVIDQLSRSEYEAPVANMDDIELENGVEIAELEPEVAEDPVPVVEVNERIINPDGYFNIKYPPGFRSQNQ